ncbi:MAG: hypothetical protein HWD60_07340 [Defluviicoccus sp.]|nr:MAG: hypothetical protein HWD60_07340 [Defluviicoccus sp.]
MPLFEERRRARPTLERMCVVVMMMGVLLVVRAGEVAAQPAEAVSSLDQGSSAEGGLMPLPVTLSNIEPSGGMRDDLPPSIRKARPSGSVPADLPGRTQRDCAILRSVEVYRGIGRHTAVAVSPADLPGVTPDGPCPPEE